MTQTDVNDNVMSDNQYSELLGCLNTKQRHFYNHAIHWIKTKDAPIYAFLTGGAGVDESVVIKALYQTLYRSLNPSEGQNADEKRVCCAHTLAKQLLTLMVLLYQQLSIKNKH